MAREEMEQEGGQRGRAIPGGEEQGGRAAVGISDMQRCMRLGHLSAFGL